MLLHRDRLQFTIVTIFCLDISHLMIHNWTRRVDSVKCSGPGLVSNPLFCLHLSVVFWFCLFLSFWFFYLSNIYVFFPFFLFSFFKILRSRFCTLICCSDGFVWGWSLCESHLLQMESCLLHWGSHFSFWCFLCFFVFRLHFSVCLFSHLVRSVHLSWWWKVNFLLRHFWFGVAHNGKSFTLNLLVSWSFCRLFWSFFCFSPLFQDVLFLFSVWTLRWNVFNLHSNNGFCVLFQSFVC